MRLCAAFLAGLVVLAGCGGGGGPKTDADAISSVVKDAVHAAADGDGDKACGYLTPDAQRQAVLQVGGGVLGSVDCATAVKRAQLILSPLDKQRLQDLEATNVQIKGTSAGATIATTAGAPASEAISVQITLQKVGEDWKIAGFVNGQGVPGF